MQLKSAVAALLLGSGPTQAVPARAITAPAISDRYHITFSPERTRLTLAYIRQHYDPAATSVHIQPRMVVLHWTASATLQQALAELMPERLSGRADIRRGGLLNVGAHYLVDRDGTIYRLIDDTLMARHVIGLNRAAIGIENVGTNDLTAAQVRADTQLVEWLTTRHDLTTLIGHAEYGRFRGSTLWEERELGYFTRKSDPGAAFMAQVRAALAADGVRLRSAP
ncbi:N-acetyl-anhydromuramyl-L-alanine amidase AmpD [Deinococcus metalli]|uniref:N-acetylmuramoyl-L-alanine amidase n=1 Tax=Deinococcus metalli TaxID=1141878 RepID=A0A7W8NQU7_9DEIO|nr:peptidoglycan recognition family protein [Deinococcus metalli]MBB5377225.1 N-acetyl-anhydromuramyl-L-alanine amidase AmpD [Deinococcus metalli]GHF48048.1 N-acetylmuramoyl-L-alanine amidase [Deinococcus metalli]